ncbi:hypothetical protein OG241_41530 [Streptomyces sp. NBC_01390]|uniref:hypothetical protein n=1 Tax=Streptomyces sp. NBC_01390 TaxID=2903850 RepID=UPI00325684F6
MRSSERIRTGLAGMALLSAVSVAGCGGQGDKSSDDAESDEPVKVTRCAVGKDLGSSMDIQATNEFADPTAYLIQLYWFDAQGRQAHGVKMTTDGIAPGKTITFTVHGVPGDTEGWTCDVKVLGTQ